MPDTDRPPRAEHTPEIDAPAEQSHHPGCPVDPCRCLFLAAMRPRPTPPAEHRLTGDIGRQSCTCGWTPRLGEIVFRAFDKHVLETRVTPPESSHAHVGPAPFFADYVCTDPACPIPPVAGQA